MNRKYRPLIAATAAVAVAAVTIFAARNDFGLGRNMEITVNMMRELSLNYVDPVDPDKLMEGAAAGMVSDLDPYTEYIPEEGMQDFELLTTGKYGGIGALIRQKEDYVRIATKDRRPIGPVSKSVTRSSPSTERTQRASRPKRFRQGSKESPEARSASPSSTSTERSRPPSSAASASQSPACPSPDGPPMGSDTSATATSPKGVTRR